MVLNLEILAEFRDHSIVNIGTIVCDDPLRYAIPENKVILNEPSHNIVGNGSKRGFLYALREVINSENDIEKPIRSSRINLSNHINAHIANSQEAIKTFNETRGTCTLLA